MRARGVELCTSLKLFLILTSGSCWAEARRTIYFVPGLRLHALRRELPGKRSAKLSGKAFHISYPNSNDIAAAKKLGVGAGGDIMLHGLPKEYAWVGKAHVLHDWTDGCVAVTNEEMDEIWKLVRVGTPIEIKP